VEVREVLPHEYEEAGRATASAWQEYVAPYPDFGWSSFLPAVADIAGRAQGAVIFGAFENGHALGTVTLQPERRSVGAYQLTPDTAYIELLGVAPTARRRGIGTALMQAAIKEARHQGKRAVVLTYDPVDVGPKELYERLGFADTGERTTQGEFVARLDLPT
jgi:ribosomal protein S18 acetylase RimI-like enzyme